MGPDFGRGQGAPFRSTSKMRLLLLLLGLAVWITFGLISPAKGDMFQLQNMIKNMTGKPITNYISYGCHCGWGGAAKPVDATDRCCHAHDCCYAELGRKSCFAKMKSYNYSNSHGNIFCGAGSWCETMSCECDKMLALCLLKEMDTYDSKYRWYSTSHPCHCRGLTLPCSFAKS